MFEAVSVNREITGRGANILLCADGSVPLSGVLADKLQPEMLGQMVHIARDIVTVTPDTPRALSAAEYAAALNACGGNAAPAANLAEGLQMALDLAGEDGVVIAAGSLYFAGALRTEMNLPWK